MINRLERIIYFNRYPFRHDHTLHRNHNWKGGQLARETNAATKLISKDEKFTTLKLPYRKVYLISKNYSTNWTSGMLG